ncbi:Phage-related protein [Pseudomonas guariconensis]|uniref:phage tail protein n=1 Tax=Pseudomonas guariconensis TaxID=1288410 RepID=UPI00088962BB|nr:phage tail protein [Pseudomonas guariconensis]SDE14958.1 Phage-related protein [Pseudomonas guariconensis]
METLPNIGRPPDYGLTASGTFARDVTGFGDGYELRRVAGLQPFRRTWNLTWTALKAGQKDTLRNFLSARRGVEAFQCTIPGEGDLRVICAEPPVVNHIAYRLYTLTATFIEDLNP